MAEDELDGEGFELPVGPDKTALSFEAFNTFVTIAALQEEGDVRHALAKALSACRRYESLFSRTIPTSEISKINNASGSRVEISFDTYDVLHSALRYCSDSEGLFDITIGPLSKLWNFRNGTVPSDVAIEEASRFVDWRKLRLGRGSAEGASSASYWAGLELSGASVDVGGIAKGWIADRICALLEGEGLSSFVVDLGGNVAVRGRKADGEPWRVGIRNPQGEGIVGRVELSNASAVTSGVYERCFFVDGVRYHHIVDPKTGRPAQTDLASATVLAARSLDAEGFSTTLLALGERRAEAFVKRTPEIQAAILVGNDGSVRVVE